MDDNEWGFGQILPVFLLVGPIVATIEFLIPEDQPDQADGRPTTGNINESGTVREGNY